LRERNSKLERKERGEREEIINGCVERKKADMMNYRA